MDNSILRHPPLPFLPIHHFLSNNINGDTDTNTNIDLPLCLIQVSPIVDNHEHVQDHLNLLSSPLVKLELAALCRNQELNYDDDGENDRPWIVWDNNHNNQEEQDVSGIVTATVPLQMKSGTMCQNHTQSLHIWNKQRRRNDNRQTATDGNVDVDGNVDMDMDAKGKDKSMDTSVSASAGKVILPIITLQSQDPIEPNGIPCFIRVYSIPHCCTRTNMNGGGGDMNGNGDGGDWSPVPNPAQILEGTLIQILPTMQAIPIPIQIPTPIQKSLSMSMSMDENRKEDKALDSQPMVVVTMYEANAISKSISNEDDYFYNYQYSNIHIQRAPSLHRDIMGQTSLYDQFLNRHLHNHHNPDPQANVTLEEMHQIIHQHDEEILRSFEEDTVQAVTIRMKMLLGLDGGNGNCNGNDNDADYNDDNGGHGVIRVGTTPNAISAWDEQYKRRTRMENMLRRRRSGVKSISTSPRTNNKKKDTDLKIGFSLGGALTVHNPHHGSGKTLLVSTLARHVLHCHHVHTINAATLFAKYGASGTDAALECMLHSIVMKAAAHSMSSGRHGGAGAGTSNSRVGSVCIILDHLETFLPPAMSGGRGIGDPAIPALNAMAAYLSKVVHCIQVKKYFPYPTINNNPLYNIHIHGKSSSSSADAGGYVLPIRVCLVGIVTCDDDGGRRASGGYNMNMGMGTVLDALGENRYRIPSLSIKGQCDIFITMALAKGTNISAGGSASTSTNTGSYSNSSRTTCILLSEDARRELPTIIAKMKPKIVMFRAVLSKLEQIVSQKKMETKFKTKLAIGSRSDYVNGQDSEQKKVSSLSVALPLSLEADADDVREAFATIHAASASKIVSNNLMTSIIASKSNSNVSKRNEAGLGAEKKSSTIVRNDYFSSIGGNSEAKKSLEDALAFDEGKRLLLKQFGLSPPCGVLMFGPPGTGKTLLARATAEMMQADTNQIGVELSDSGPDSVSGGMFISLSASTIVRSEVGQSEKLVTSSFEMAAKNAPSVIFIDEFQALFTSRDGKGSNRLSSTLLQCMDDISKWRDADETIITNSNSTSQTSEEEQDNAKSGRVVVLAATNTPWMIDRAFLRNGRFDRVVHVGLPTLEERKSILRVYVSQMKLERDAGTSIDSICQAVAEKCIGFSGADLEALVRSAAVRCLHESSKKSSTISSPSSSASGESFGVGLRHFIDAKDIDMPNPSSNKALVERLRTWRP